MDILIYNTENYNYLYDSYQKLFVSEDCRVTLDLYSFDLINYSKQTTRYFWLMSVSFPITLTECVLCNEAICNLKFIVQEISYCFMPLLGHNFYPFFSVRLETNIIFGISIQIWVGSSSCNTELSENIKWTCKK